MKSASLCHLANVSYRLKRRLGFQAPAWNFGGDAAANTMLTRTYRAPFVAPDRV